MKLLPGFSDTQGEDCLRPSCNWGCGGQPPEAVQIQEIPSQGINIQLVTCVYGLILSGLSIVTRAYLLCCCLAWSAILELMWPTGINQGTLGFQRFLETVCSLII